MLATTVALKGQSRSTFCADRVAGTKSLCHRLVGHKGAHRASLQAQTAKPSGRLASIRTATEGGESMAVTYTVPKEPAAEVAKPRRTRRSRAAKVVTLPMAEYRRLVAASSKTTKRTRFVTSGKPSARLA